MRVSVVLVLWLSLVACSLQPPEELLRPRPLLAPQLLGQSLTSQQAVSFSSETQRKQLLVDVQLNSQMLTLLAFDGFSTPLFEIKFDGQKLSQQAFIPSLDEQFPHYIVADMQLVYWPLEAINQAYKNQDLHLIESPCADFERCRTLYWKQQAISVIRYSSLSPWQGIIELENVVANYRLHIETLSYRE